MPARPGEHRVSKPNVDELDMRMRRAFERSLNILRCERLIRPKTRLADNIRGVSWPCCASVPGQPGRRRPRAMREGLKARRMQLQNQMQTLHVVSPLAILSLKQRQQ